MFRFSGGDQVPMNPGVELSSFVSLVLDPIRPVLGNSPSQSLS